MLGVAPPTGWRHEGRDFSPLLRGGEMAARDIIFGQYDLHNEGLAYLRMARTADWKLVRHYFTNGLDELYHLKTDPGETRNLYDNPDHAAIQATLQLRLTEWQRSINDPILRRLDGEK